MMRAARSLLLTLVFITPLLAPAGASARPSAAYYKRLAKKCNGLLGGKGCCLSSVRSMKANGFREYDPKDGVKCLRVTMRCRGAYAWCKPVQPVTGGYSEGAQVPAAYKKFDAAADRRAKNWLVGHWGVDVEATVKAAEPTRRHLALLQAVMMAHQTWSFLGDGVFTREGRSVRFSVGAGKTPQAAPPLVEELDTRARWSMHRAQRNSFKVLLVDEGKVSDTLQLTMTGPDTGTIMVDDKQQPIRRR